MFIIHLADIHIGRLRVGSGESRYDEYIEVFDKVKELITSYKGNAIVVVAGDVFHEKTKFTPEAVRCFHHFLQTFVGFPLVIIMGNHDTDQNNGNIDLISPLLDEYNHREDSPIYYKKNTETFVVNGVKFLHIAMNETKEAMNETKEVMNETKEVMNETKEAMNETKEVTADNDAILLYHGMVGETMIKTDTGNINTIDNKCVVNKSYLKNFKCAILGDIHSYQLIPNTNAVYAGSLIQQNMGESLDKGFVIWNTDDYSHKRVLVKNDSGYLKLDLSKYSYEDTLKLKKVETIKNIIGLKIITSKDIKNKVKIIEHIEKLYSMSIGNTVINTEEELIAGTKIGYEVQDRDKLIEDLLIQSLNENKYNTEDVSMILSLHKKYYNNNIVENRNKWTVDRLEWDNLVNYGTGNVLDFNNIPEHKICGIIAPNTAGKSSTFDILMWALFGKTTRFSNKSIIRKYQKIGKVKLYFTSNKVKYCVSGYSDGKNRYMKLYQQKNNGSWKRIGDKVGSAYKQMKLLVGSYDEFITTTYASSDATDFVKLKSDDRRKTLSKIFGISNLESIVTDINGKELKNIRNDIEKLVLPVFTGDHILEISNTENKIKLLDIEILIQDIDTIKEIVSKMKNINILENYDETLRQLDFKINIIKELQSENETSIDLIRSKELKTLYDKYKSITIPDDEAISNNVDELKTLQSQFIEKPPILMDELLPINEINKELIDLENKTTPPSYDKLYEINKNITNKNNILLQTHIGEINKMKKDIKDLLLVSGLKFNDSCNECVENIKHYDKLIYIKKNELMEKEKLENVLEEYKIIVRKELELLLCEQKNIKDEVEIYKNNKERIKLLNDMMLCHKYNKFKENHNKIDLLKKEIQTFQTLKSDYDNQRKEYFNYLYSLYYQTQNDISNTKKTIYTINEDKLIDKYNYIKNKYNNINEALVVNLTVLRDNTLNTRAELLSRIDWLKKDYKLLNNKKLYDELKIKESYLEAYVKILGNKGLETKIIKQNMEEVVIQANKILSSFDISLSTSINEKNLCLYIDNINGDQIGTVSVGSGFQKVIINIAIRMALTSITQSSAQFMLIDEGFDSLDNTNTENIHKLLEEIKTNYKFMFLISHKESIQTVIEHKIKINKNSDISHLNNSINLKYLNSCSDDDSTYEVDMVNVDEDLMEIVNVKSKNKKIIIDEEINMSDYDYLINTEGEKAVCKCGSSVANNKSSVNAHKKVDKHLRFIKELHNAK